MQRRRFILISMLVVALLAAIPVASAFGAISGGHGQRPSILAAVAVGTGFTYQGRLNDAGSPANGQYDLRFILYDAETGGAQVGATVEKADVVVTAGLFTTTLDFGAVFAGDARWIEIAVRPGTSTGAYTVLSPRQAITPVPYALYAKSAGLTLPFVGTATSIAANGILDITQSGAGSAIIGRGTAAETDPTILGTTAGSGAAVRGDSTGASGTGVLGTATGTSGVGVQGTSSGATGAGGQFIGSGPATTALDISNGAVRVSGTARTAFVHVVNAGNTCTNVNQTAIDDSLVTLDPANTLLFVTQLGGTTPAPLSVAYSATCNGTQTNKWVITSGGPVAGLSFNVLVIKSAP